jgi:hypothetical protein
MEWEDNTNNNQTIICREWLSPVFGDTNPVFAWENLWEKKKSLLGQPIIQWKFEPAITVSLFINLPLCESTDWGRNRTRLRHKMDESFSAVSCDSFYQFHVLFASFITHRWIVGSRTCSTVDGQAGTESVVSLRWHCWRNYYVLEVGQKYYSFVSTASFCKGGLRRKYERSKCQIELIL